VIPSIIKDVQKLNKVSDAYEKFFILIANDNQEKLIENVEEYGERAKDIFEQILNLKGQNKSIILLVKGA